MTAPEVGGHLLRSRPPVSLRPPWPRRPRPPRTAPAGERRPSPAQLRRRRGTALAVVLLVVAGLVAGHLASRRALASAEASAAAADARLAAAEAGREAVTAALADQQALATAAEQASAAAQERADADVDSAAARRAEAQTSRDAAAATRPVVEATRSDLAGTLVDLQGRAADVGDLRTCLAGVVAAAERIDRDRLGALGALQAVIDPCQRAQGFDGAGAAVFPFDFPDPFVLRAGGRYYAYATNSAGGSVQLITSTDLAGWSYLQPALERVPGWAVEGATWAPSVLSIGGRWVLYYAVRERASGRQCLSSAVADSPEGPFVDGSAGPLVCDRSEGGSIDPSPFLGAGGVPYLLWKSEGEVVGRRSQLRVQQLAPDGRSVVGGVAVLLQTDQAWEGRTIEAPTMLATPLGYLLLYSANSWTTAEYAVGAARCDTPVGPCRKLGPVFGTSGAITGPGGAEVFVDAAGVARLAFHAWSGTDVGWPFPRFLHIGTLDLSGPVPAVS